MKIDPVKREIIRSALTTIADNMIVSVMRTSRSTVVKNNLDFSSAICSAGGELVAQGLALPVHLGATMPALRGCLDWCGSDLAPGDILASNDPYAGGSHLNDVFMFKPIFVGGELIMILSLILHHTDMGGRVPGGNAADSTEIYQEGLRIPPCKIFEKGKLNQTLWRIIENNVRVPDRVLADMRAQIAALEAAAKEVNKLLERYDARELGVYMLDLVDYAERLARESIRKLPQGRVEFTEWNDDDGVGGGPVKIQCALTVADDEIIVDFKGTSSPAGGALNTNYWFTASCTYAALRTVLDPTIPNNAGVYRPIRVIAPEGSFVNPVFPAPFGARGQGGYRVRTVVLGALAKLMPERMPACPGGSEFAIVVAGYGDGPRRPPFLFLEFHNISGAGATAEHDGQDAGPYALGNQANVPVEILEAEAPLLVEEYAFLADSEGAGRRRGALGIVRQYRMLASEATLQVRSDRQLHAPWGMAEGMAGAPARTYLRSASQDFEAAPSKFIRTVKRGDVFRAELPGSGGYGNPLARELALVEEDFRQGKITRERARQIYGAEIDPATGKADARKSAQLRGALTKKAQNVA
jgi:N-methylhydantoinase B